MILRRYQWVLGIVWLVVAGLVTCREAMLPAAVTGRMRQGNEWLIVMTAVVFAMWNFVRWYAYVNRRDRECQSPFRTKRQDESGGYPNTSTD